ncbi:MAG: 3'-5' exonuclease [Thermoplasmatota archaeon]
MPGRVVPQPSPGEGAPQTVAAAPEASPGQSPPRWVAFDLETTGVQTERDRIFEFCFMELDGDLGEVSRWTELVNPGIPIPDEVVALVGLTAADLAAVAAAPPFGQWAARIQRLVENATLVGHNAARFDIPLLHQELRRAGQPGLLPNTPCIDTHALETFVNSHSLAASYRRYTGHDLAGAHRSTTDTAACVELLRRQRTAHPKELGGALDTLLASKIEAQRGKGIQWLDFGRRLYQGPDGVVRFGRWSKKHADKPLSQVGQEDRSYLTWMVERGDFSPEVKAVVKAALG